LIILIMLGEEYKSRSSTLCSSALSRHFMSITPKSIQRCRYWRLYALLEPGVGLR
jgi:hypothetical protein